MVTITLDDQDRAVLERLHVADAAVDVDSLADRAGVDQGYLLDRLPALEDNGLVTRVAGDAYELTEDGRRVLGATVARTEDGRIDTTPDVERRIESFDLRPDVADAVHAAVSFLRFWGEAFAGEIIDATYSEYPAGFESADRWWENGVRDRLERLPAVEPAETSDRPWRYTGSPGVSDRTADGRIAPPDEFERSSVRFALHRLDLDDGERAAVRSAFERLLREDEATGAALRERVYPDHDAGYGSAAVWWDDCVRDALESLPGIESPDDADDRWQYRQTDEGTVSNVPGTEAADDPIDSDDER